MNLVLNEEERILRRGAQEYFGERLPVSALRKLRDDDDVKGFDIAAWREMADMGWAGVLLPEEHGGASFGYQGLGQVLEASGRTLAASPLVSTALVGAPLVLAAGSAAQQAAVLPAVAAGDCVLALALDEQPRHAPTAIATRATPHGQAYRLVGSKTFVLDGHVADQLIVVARTAGEANASAGLTLFLVPAGTPGLDIARTRMVDSRNAARVTLHDVELGADAVLGPVGEAWPLLERVLDGARAGLAAEMLGTAQEAFDRTVAYLKLREQFGVPIGSFQALKHRAALMFCELELTRSAVLAALDALDSGREDVAALASLAKCKACETLELVSGEAVQLHGGIGMTDAEEIGLFLKRARVAQQTFGDAAFHRQRYADLLGL